MGQRNEGKRSFIKKFAASVQFSFYETSKQAHTHPTSHREIVNGENKKYSREQILSGECRLLYLVVKLTLLYCLVCNPFRFTVRKVQHVGSLFFICRHIAIKPKENADTKQKCVITNLGRIEPKRILSRLKWEQNSPVFQRFPAVGQGNWGGGGAVEALHWRACHNAS